MAGSGQKGLDLSYSFSGTTSLAPEITFTPAATAGSRFQLPCPLPVPQPDWAPTKVPVAAGWLILLRGRSPQPLL